jgi:hypothetical protein
VKKLETQKLLRNICKEHGIKVIFRSKLKNESGSSIEGLCDLDIKKRLIFINKDVSNRKMASAVFHEIGHIYCLENGIWKRFHKEDNLPATLVFKVENWIEWWAKHEWDAYGMRKLFGHYSFSYTKAKKEKIVEWIEKNYNE